MMKLLLEHSPLSTTSYKLHLIYDLMPHVICTSHSAKGVLKNTQSLKWNKDPFSHDYLLVTNHHYNHILFNPDIFPLQTTTMHHVVAVVNVVAVVKSSRISHHHYQQ